MDCQHGLSAWIVSMDGQHGLSAQVASTNCKHTAQLPAQIEEDNRNKN
jgi:hypothetical protein